MYEMAEIKLTLVYFSFTIIHSLVLTDKPCPKLKPMKDFNLTAVRVYLFK